MVAASAGAMAANDHSSGPVALRSRRNGPIRPRTRPAKAQCRRHECDATEQAARVVDALADVDRHQRQGGGSRDEEDDPSPAAKSPTLRTPDGHEIVDARSPGVSLLLFGDQGAGHAAPSVVGRSTGYSRRVPPGNAGGHGQAC